MHVGNDNNDANGTADMNQKRPLIYSVFISTFPGGSLLYSKMYQNFHADTINDDQRNAPHPMSFAALFYAIQTYANELCLNKPMTLKHFYQSGKIICFKIYENVLITAVLSMNIAAIDGLEYCENIGKAFTKKLQEENYAITSGKKIKGFSKLLKKCNELLLKNLIQLSYSFLNFENILLNNRKNNNNNVGTISNKKHVDNNLIIGTFDLSSSSSLSKSSPRSFSDDDNNVKKRKENNSLKASPVTTTDKKGGKKHNNNKNIFSGIQFFKRNRSNKNNDISSTPSSISKTGSNNHVSNSYKKKEQEESQSKDGNVDVNNDNSSYDGTIQINNLYIFKKSELGITTRVNTNSSNNNIVITQLDQTDLMEYITEHKKTLEKKDIKWYAFRCKNKFIGYVCNKLFVVKRINSNNDNKDVNNEENISAKLLIKNQESTDNNNLTMYNNNKPFPMDFVLNEKNLNILNSIKSGIHFKQGI